MLIEIKDLHHTFNPGSPIQKEVLCGISLDVREGEFVALIGETGSGKTTLVLHINGLLIPSAGSVRVGDVTVTPKTKKTGELREIVGIVFQYPEHQLFEESVAREISFALRNKSTKLTGEEIDRRVRKAAELVNLDYESFASRSPYSLSSGEQRKVAIASILAMDPQILIFDEPTQGLDARSSKETLRNIKALNKSGKTVIVISHDLEEVVEIADRVAILKKGKILFDVPAPELFSRPEVLRGIRHLLPDLTELLLRLREEGWGNDAGEYRSERAAERILWELKR